MIIEAYQKNKRLRKYHCILLIIVLIICSPVILKPQATRADTGASASAVRDVKEYAKKDNFISWFLRQILVEDVDSTGVQYKTLFDHDRVIIRKSSGKIIRKINVTVLDVFGASVGNPDDTVRSWLQDGMNSLHAKTKEWLVKNKLLFSEGQKLTPFYIHENERILRQSPYIYDVRIIPQVIPNEADSVDVMIYIQDIWSINGTASYSPAGKNASFSFNDLNFLGFGNEFRAGLKFNRELSHGWDWDGSYTVDNIKNTFISSGVYYLSEVNRQRYGMMVIRDFFSPIITWGGGIAQGWQNTRYPNMKNASGVPETARYNLQDYWLGYAFDFKPFDPGTIFQNRFNIAARTTRTVFSERPDSDTTHLFQNNTFYLGRIGFAYRSYFKDSYIYGLGKTEDVPLIKMVEVLFGYERGASSDRQYYGLKTGYSFYEDDFGYMYGGLQSGAFRSNKGWLNRTSVLEFMYFSRLNSIGDYNWRHYIGSRYSYSYDPVNPQDILDINEVGGLRGFSESSLLGNKKLVFNYEADVFVPLRFLGFSLAVITFADFGLIGANDNSLFSSKLYQGYGLGFRIKNEHLIFPQFQFMFAFYPNTPDAGGRHFNMFHQSSMYYHFNQYYFSVPSIVAAD
jgi:hypothetical protein